MGSITRWWKGTRHRKSGKNPFASPSKGAKGKVRTRFSIEGDKVLPTISRAFSATCVEHLATHLPILDLGTARRAEVGMMRMDAQRLTGALRALEHEHRLEIVVRSNGKPQEVTDSTLIELDTQLGSASHMLLDMLDVQASRLARIRVYFYQWQGAFLVSEGPVEVAGRIPRRVVEAHGLFEGTGAVHVDALHACPPVMEPDFPIDIVFTWVNHADPGWQALRASVRDVDLSSETDDGKSAARFVSRDELRYALRAVALHAPWVRNVYVATNCAPPAWVDLEAEGLHWVPHEAFMPAEALPTFNSHAIESCLHHIPGLSDHFIYFNDDLMLCAPAAPSTFFLSNGMTKAFLEDYGTVLGDPHADDPDYLNAARNGKRLLEAAFSRSVSELHKHVPMALRRDVMLELEERFPEAFHDTARARFRSMDDTSTVSFLHHHYGYLTCRTVLSTITSKLVKPQNKRYPAALTKLLYRPHRPIAVCVNDGGNAPHASNWDTHITEFLQAMFPEPSRFEKTGAGEEPA